MAGVAVLVATALAGCSPASCSPAAQYPPSVWLDASAWTAAHPSATLTACLDGTCRTVTTGETGSLQLALSSRAHVPSAGDADYELMVHSDPDGLAPIQKTVELRRASESGACGTQSWWRADASIDAAGRLTVSYGTPGEPVGKASPTP
jgi:hypothetical protein